LFAGLLTQDIQRSSVPAGLVRLCWWDSAARSLHHIRASWAWIEHTSGVVMFGTLGPAMALIARAALQTGSLPQRQGDVRENPKTPQDFGPRLDVGWSSSEPETDIGP
jgi:hypothetical protein